MQSEIIYLDVERQKRNTAGAKAPQDISKLCEKLGIEKFAFPLFPNEKNYIYQKLWLLFICTFYWIKFEKVLKPGCIVIYQHPMYGARVAERFIPRIQRKKGCKFIAIVHDLESLRKGIEGVIKNNEKTNEISDNVILKHFDVIICHNSRMKEYLVQQGFPAERLVELEIFDYLCDCDRKQPIKKEPPSIAIAGNLAKGKCPYIYKMHGSENSSNVNLRVHLYGNNYDKTGCEQENLIYHGSFQPEELPQKLEGDFGLVWDGTSAESCEGNTGEYLKYNNPHKTSLYLAANMPVVTWSQAAIAGFVKENNVGIVVDSLYELEDAINDITVEDYLFMCENAKKMGAKIRSGYFFKKALRECLNYLEQ